MWHDALRRRSAVGRPFTLCIAENAEGGHGIPSVLAGVLSLPYLPQSDLFAACGVCLYLQIERVFQVMSLLFRHL